MAYNRPATTIPEIWAGTFLSGLYDALVFRNVCNTDYEGEIRGFGDTVHINELGPITINDYSATSTSALTVQSLSDADKVLKIDRAKSFTFWIDDLDRVQAKPALMQEAMTRSAYATANEIDEYIASLYTQAAIVAGGSISGSTITGVDITSTNVLKYLSIAAQKLDEANVPKQGRWMVEPPWFSHKLAIMNIVQNTANSSGLAAGYAGMDVYGFAHYTSNNVTNGTPAGDDACIMFGYPGSISFAAQIASVETARPSLIGFKTLVKGLTVYGVKVVRPNTLGVLYADYTAEAS